VTLLPDTEHTETIRMRVLGKCHKDLGTEFETFKPAKKLEKGRKHCRAPLSQRSQSVTGAVRNTFYFRTQLFESAREAI